MTSVPTHIPEAPSGWTGPHNMFYLKYKVKGIDGKNIRIIRSFDEAVQKAAEINGAWLYAKTSDNFPSFWSKDSKPCGGITKTKTGYDLRRNNQIIHTPQELFGQGMASWVIN